MIITRAPLRISLGGGGTDLPGYYRECGGFVLSAAIDKYVYITLHSTFEPGLTLKYSQVEKVEHAYQVKHPIFREVWRALQVPHLEIASHADIPAGTGLGSSSSFTVALLKAKAAYYYLHTSPERLAKEACHIEINRLNAHIGKQDQYIAAYGGLTAFTFHQNERVSVDPLHLSSFTLHNLEDNLLLFFTGYSRSASTVLGKAVNVPGNLDQVKTIGLSVKRALEGGELEEFAELMNEHYALKRERSPERADIWNAYQVGLQSGALGGKLVGAGGGGFLMFYASDPAQLRDKMIALGLREVRFRFDFEGAKQL